MLLSLIGYLFCLALGAFGFWVTATQMAQGTVAASLDNLFLTMFSALMGVTCFGYLAWRFLPVIRVGASAAGGAGEAAAVYVLPADPDYKDSHLPQFNMVWIGLLVLTAIEVVLAYVQIAGLMVMLAILMLLSLVKAGMIMASFMHLRFDHRGLSWIVVVPAVFCILVMCGYFFPDSFLLLELRP